MDGAVTSITNDSASHSAARPTSLSLPLRTCSLLVHCHLPSAHVTAPPEVRQVDCPLPSVLLEINMQAGRGRHGVDGWKYRENERGQGGSEHSTVQALCRKLVERRKKTAVHGEKAELPRRFTPRGVTQRLPLPRQELFRLLSVISARRRAYEDELLASTPREHSVSQ